MDPHPELVAYDPFAGSPRLNGARRVGGRAGTELLHALAVTGARPLEWEVGGLPAGVTVDDHGVLRGRWPHDGGVVPIRVRVRNDQGSIDETVELHVGEPLALTPPMGWNSWNVYADSVNAEVVLRAAEAMVSTGMRDLGYQYVNIDDHWHAASRASDGSPTANPDTFPDGLAPLAERVHALGLKLGIYSDAAERTCGNCFGGLGYEEIDAATYAEWGVDYLKYDYCHAPRDLDAARRRYGAMGSALEACGRSIVFSVCEWGGRDPWKWAPEAGASLWRTTGDIFDTFSRGPLGVWGIARRNLELAEFAGPGRWNDPDMLLIGNHGAGRATGVLRLPFKGNWRPKIWSFRGLDSHEAHTHMTLWAMMAAPLLASHDLVGSDDLDLALLTNPEVIAVNQDVLGAQGRLVEGGRGRWALHKPLAGGGVAISISNLTRRPQSTSVELGRFGDPARHRLLNAWTFEEMAESSTLTVRLAPHGSAMFTYRPLSAADSA